MEIMASVGSDMYSLAEKLFPICRSITGEGVRQSLRILQEYIPLEIHEVPSGTPVFDWTVPPEWNIRDAWIKGPNGETIVDFKCNNLHILQYSIPIHQVFELEDLKKHLFTLPDQPDLIPYRTSYYQQNWGFCLAHHELQRLSEGSYEVYIDASLEEGSLTYGELYLPGESTQEVLLSAHICHPSLANDNLSGISLLTFLAQCMLGQKNRYSYRFLFIPGTIGSITWLALNEPKVQNIQHGLVASLLGDAGGFTYKRSRRGDAEIDKVAEYVLKHSGHPYQVFDFFPYGYDERQFCSPGFNLPVGNLTRSPFGGYPEYHTSGDNLQLIQAQYLNDSFDIYHQIIKILEHNNYYKNLNPKCEPQLGKRGLYDAIGGDSDQKKLQMAMLWILNFSDGNYSLLDISERAELPFYLILKMSKVLIEYELIA
ncbi:MAG TPA: DUF4910 domain-containing protein [Haliscomenobacter sp.]|uniref:DUF4910 domain-containing protein n=1 Tax=Haliscomenobacter sp. TaxID=2717303 RepID=UPI002C6E943B|nr:DUF4910 domain-containing protein [Haliscomenobacter sp.]HOY18044.1 DUF4910 domain-containing protein [Haliscomenobacter sp.]